MANVDTTHTKQEAESTMKQHNTSIWDESFLTGVGFWEIGRGNSI